MPLWRGASWIVNQSAKRFFPLVHLVEIIRNSSYFGERRNSGGKKIIISRRGIIEHENVQTRACYCFVNFNSFAVK